MTEHSRESAELGSRSLALVTLARALLDAADTGGGHVEHRDLLIAAAEELKRQPGESQLDAAIRHVALVGMLSMFSAALLDTLREVTGDDTAMQALRRLALRWAEVLTDE